MAHTEESLRKLKNDELKDILRELSLPLSGKKDVLVQRILDAEAPNPAESEDVAMAEIVEPKDGELADVESALEESVPPSPAPIVAVLTAVVRPRSASVEGEESEAPVAKRAKLDVKEVVTAPAAVVVVVETPVVDSLIASDIPTPLFSEEVKVEEAEVEERETEPVQLEQEEEKVVVPVEEEDDWEPEVYELEAEGGKPSDMYLDTINRQVLDFDFERLCSITLSHNHIYACLTCGKYFQGRGRKTPAFDHSLTEDHHVYIGLSSRKVYVLPDSYEVLDPSLRDIQHLLRPTFTPSLLSQLDATLTPHYDLNQNPYYPGFVGLNNIKSNSYMNCILHSLLHVTPLRDYFLLSSLVNPVDPTSSRTTELVHRTSDLFRKYWNPQAFKGQVSPHEVLQECVKRSEGRFKITESGDPVEFLGWLLNTLHRDLGGNKKGRSSIIYSAFQGEVRVDDQQILTSGEYGGKPKFDFDRDIKTSKSPFLFLAIDLPAPPLFQDSVEKNIIPQVPLSVILSKYNGTTTQEVKGSILRRYKITSMPDFLILHIKRFTKNNFVEEKNPTIVNFPLRGVDMKDYMDQTTPISSYYDLISNVTQSSPAISAREETLWKTQVHLRAPRDAEGKIVGGKTEDDEKWFNMMDLKVEEINRNLISLGESYIQIWEKRTPTGTHNLVVETPKAKSIKP